MRKLYFTTNDRAMGTTFSFIVGYLDGEIETGDDLEFGDPNESVTLIVHDDDHYNDGVD